MKAIIASVITTILLFIGVAFITGTTMPNSGGDNDKTTESSAVSNTAESEEAAAESAARTKADQYISPVPLPDYLELAGEQVPLHQWDVRERLDRELLVNTYWHSSTVRMLKLAQRYFPMIEPIFAEHGIPDDMKFIVMVESGLQNASASHAGAKGPWQFLASSGKELGLEVAGKYNTEVDERYHWEKSTEAACKYLKNEYNSFQNWTLAAAAYNAGHGRVRGALRDQKVENYYDLYLTTETARYVFRILAMKEIYNNPEKYGFFLDSSTKYSPIDTKEIEVTSIASIADFAKKHNTTYKEFKLLNQWLRSTKLTSRKSGKKYIVKVPY